MNRRPARLAAAGLAALACLLPTAPAGAAPSPGGSFSGDLTGVSRPAAGDCWAVGGTGNNVAIADHWDGTAWSVVPFPVPRALRTGTSTPGRSPRRPPPAAPTVSC